MSKNANKAKEPGQILIWQQVPRFKKKKINILIKFKIRFSQLIAKILLKQRSLNHTTQCLTGHNQIWHHFFIKNIKVF